MEKITNVSSNSNDNILGKDKQSSEPKLSKYEQLISKVDPKILEEWTKTQLELKDKLIEADFTDLSKKENFPKKVAGVDISVSKNNQDKAVVGIVVINLTDFSIIYEDYELITMKEPYVPGFLAFREVDPLICLLNKIKNTEYYPDVILVDGNGILHCNRFGLASHLGVLSNTPTIGCGKSVFAVDGITEKKVKALSKEKLLKKGDSVELVGLSGSVWGAALRSTDKSVSPIIISIGHKISLEGSLKIVKESTNYRVPESVRIADLTTRLILRNYENCGFKEFDIKEFLMKEKRNFLVMDVEC